MYNGEYGEHDLLCANPEYILDKQKEAYQRLIGKVVDDFKIVKVEFDWGKHIQVGLAECIHCGCELTIEDVARWVRHKCGIHKCKCQKKKYNSKVSASHIELSLVDYTDPSFLGMSIGERTIVAYKYPGNFVTKCNVCGKTRIQSCKSFLKGKIESCNHIVVSNYQQPQYIGVRVGHLTTVEYVGKYFKCRCDCGNVVDVSGTHLFKYKRRVSCLRPGCSYSNEWLSKTYSAAENGRGFEKQFFLKLKESKPTWELEQTPSHGDYGVDIVAVVDGVRVAIQCKNHIGNTPIAVGGVQQVYAGGMFYDCTQFWLVCPQGFTSNAERMAKKLGVVLSKGEIPEI